MASWYIQHHALACKLEHGVPVVDHLLKPHALMEHPHNDETTLITGGKLLERVIPADNKCCTAVALQSLVQRQVPCCCCTLAALQILSRGTLKAKHLYLLAHDDLKPQ